MKCLVCFFGWLSWGNPFSILIRGLKKKKLSGNDFSVLRVLFVPNSVSAIKNMEVIGRPLTLRGNSHARMGTLRSSGQAL